MATQINIHQAKTHLSKLLEQVESGKEFIIARAGKPVAKLGPIEQETKTKPKRKLGFAEGILTDAQIEAMLDPALDREIEELFYADNLIPND